MIEAIQSFSAFLLVLGILVFVHEFGHFAVAKFFGIGVRTFSLGLGKRMFGFRRGETDYRISWIPLGGYVRMVGDELDDQRVGDSKEFLSRPRYQRLLVYSAGAAVNILVAWLLYTVVLMGYGTWETVPPKNPYPMVIALADGGEAEAAGLQVGDRILEIGDIDLAEEASVEGVTVKEILLSPGETRDIVFMRDGEQRTTTLQTGADERFKLGDPGWQLERVDRGIVRLYDVIENSPAADAGLQVDDIVKSYDGIPATLDLEFRNYIAARPNQEVLLEIERQGERLVVSVTPENREGRGMLGVIPLSREIKKVEYGLAAAASRSFETCLEQSKLLFTFLGRLVQFKISTRALSGPLEIAQVSGDAVRGGLQSLLVLLAMISLQLGIMNLLPIPILDGGHIMILLIESVMRKDLSLRVKERVMIAGLVFLLLVFTLVLYGDVMKTFVVGGSVR